MEIGALIAAFDLKVRAGADRGTNEVRGGYVGDLLSDVMANSKEGDVWITRQIHQNIVAVASLRDLAGIIIVSGAEPAADTVDKAAQEGIPLLVSDFPAFELAGKVYKLLDAEVVT